MIGDILNTFAKIPSIAEENTVYNERVWESRVVYCYKYWGKQRDLVEKALKESQARCDPYRSPHITQVHEEDGMFVGHLTYYGID